MRYFVLENGKNDLEYAQVSNIDTSQQFVTFSNSMDEIRRLFYY
jgi:hypothetical protein